MSLTDIFELGHNAQKELINNPPHSPPLPPLERITDACKGLDSYMQLCGVEVKLSDVLGAIWKFFVTLPHDSTAYIPPVEKKSSQALYC